MAEAWGSVSVEDLGRVLLAAGSSVDYPEMPDLSGLVAARLREAQPARRPARALRLRPLLRPVFRPLWQRVAVAAAIVVLLTSGTVLVSPSARHAVAGWLGLRGVKIQGAPSGTPTPTATSRPSPSPSLALGAGLDLGTRVTLAEAQAAVPFTILVPTDPLLGQPDEVYLRQGLISNQVTLLYRSRPGLPAAAFTGAGLLLTEFQARVDEEFLLTKTVYLGSTVQRVLVGTDPGYWVSGHPHEVAYVDPNGEQTFDRPRLAGNVLLWQHGDVTLRIEADVDEGQAIAFGASVR
jgi:hypothetical protein